MLFAILQNYGHRYIVVCTKKHKRFVGLNIRRFAIHNRYCFDHCQMLVHQGFVTIQGSAQEADEAQKNYKKQLDSVKDYILERTEIDEKVYNRNKRKDWYLTKEELVNYKVVDKVIENFDDIQ